MTSVPLKDLLPDHGDVIGVIREELRSTMMREIETLSDEQHVQRSAVSTRPRGAAFGDPVTCRFDHRILDAMVNAIAPELVKRFLEITVGRQFLAEHIDPSAVAIAIPLEDVIAADPILSKLLDATGSARAALGALDVQLRNGAGAILNKIPLNLVRWSRMVDAHRLRSGRPALRRIETTHADATFMDPVELAIDKAAQSGLVLDVELEVSALEKK